MGRKTVLMKETYLYEIAKYDVAQFNGVHYYVIAELAPGEDARRLIPDTFPVSRVVGQRIGKTHRTILFTAELRPAVGANGQFVICPATGVEIVLRNDPSQILQTARAFAKSTMMDVSIELSQEAGCEHAFYEPVEHKVFIAPDEMYRHISRSLVYQGISMKDVISIVMAHEFGHAVDDTTKLKYEDYRNNVVYLNQEIRRLSTKDDYDNADLETSEKLLRLAEQVLAFQLDCEVRASQTGAKFIPKHLLNTYRIDAVQNLEMYSKSAKEVTSQLERLHQRIQFFMVLKRTSAPF